MEGFYTAKEARTKLGVTEDKFQYMVRTEQIKKVILPGRKYGIYPQSEIDELSAALTSFAHQYNKDKETEVFRVARPEDAKGMYDLGEQVMRQSGGQGIPPEKLIPFLSIPGSEIGHVLIRGKHIAGYFTVVPMYHDLLMKRMREEIPTISQIKPEQLARFEPGKPIDCFIWEVMSSPKEKHTGAYLIGKMLIFLHTLGKRGVEIEGVYATASSPEGIDLCRRMGMKLMDLPIIRPDNMPFELKIQEHPNWLTKNYISALRSYNIRQARLQRNYTSGKKNKGAQHR